MHIFLGFSKLTLGLSDFVPLELRLDRGSNIRREDSVEGIGHRGRRSLPVQWARMHTIEG